MRQPVDAQFHAKRHPVAIADLDGAGRDSAFIRALVEQLGAVVHLHLIGTPEDFLKVLRQGADAPPHLIICAHGEPAGIRFGEFVPEVYTSMLKDGVMPFECIAENVDLPGVVVINTGCSAGEAPAAKAFMRGGLKAYIGTVEPNPDGKAWPLFLASFFYELFRRSCTEREAWERAASYDEGTRLFAYHDEGGPHRA